MRRVDPKVDTSCIRLIQRELLLRSVNEWCCATLPSGPNEITEDDITRYIFVGLRNSCDDRICLIELCSDNSLRVVLMSFALPGTKILTADEKQKKKGQHRKKVSDWIDQNKSTFTNFGSPYLLDDLSNFKTQYISVKFVAWSLLTATSFFHIQLGSRIVIDWKWLFFVLRPFSWTTTMVTVRTICLDNI